MSGLEDIGAPLPPPEQAAGLWYVMHVRSRQERALAEDLRIRGIRYYLPLKRHLRYYGSRKLKVELPLFPGYLFLQGSLDDAYEADRTKRVVNIIRVADQEQLEWELKNIRMALAAGVRLDPYPYLQKGTRVEVRSGPFRGYQGVVRDRARPDRLVLGVDILGTAVSFEIHGALLEPLERHSFQPQPDLTAVV